VSSSSTSPSDKPSRRPGRLWRILKWTVLVLLLLVLVPPILILLALETGPGKRFAAEQLSDLLSTPDAGIRIEDLGGSLWDRLTIGRVVLSDADGTWLTVEDAVLDWSPLSLLNETASISLLEVGLVDMPRAPLPGPETEPAAAEAADDGRLIPELPSLPVDVRLDRLAVDRVSLGEPLLGAPADLGITGTAVWPRQGETKLTLSVQGEAATELSVTLDLGFQPASEVLALDLSVTEPEGGLVSRLAGLPTLPALDLSLTGQGTLSDWQGDLRLALDEVEAVKGEIALSGAPDRRFALTGRIDPSGSLPPDLLPEEARPWLAGGADLDIAAVMSGETVTIERFSLDAQSLEVSLAGTVGLDSDTAEVKGSVVLASDAPLNTLSPDILPPEFAPWLDGGVRLNLDVAADAQSAKVSSLTLDTESLDLAVSGTVGLEDESFDGTVSVTLAADAPLDSLTPDLLPPEARPWLTGGLRLDVTAQASEALVKVESLTLAAASIDLTASGTLDPGAEQVDARLSLDVAADAPLDSVLPEAQMGALSLQAEVKGPLETPTVRLTGDVDGLGTAEARIGRLALALETEPQDGKLQTRLDLRLSQPQVLVADVPPLPYGDLRINASALVDAEAGTAVLQSFSLRGDGLDLALDGELALPDLRGQPQLHLEAILPDLGSFEPMLADLPLGVTLDAGLGLDGMDRPIAANLDATLVGTGGLPDGIGGLLGDGLVLNGGVTYAPDGSITLSKVSLLGPNLAVSLDGRVGSEELALDWQVALDDLSAAQELMGGPAAGSLEAGGRFVQDASGRLEVKADIDGRKLVAAGERIGRLEGKIALAGKPPDLKGDIDIKAPESAYGPLSVTAKVAPAGGETFRIAPLKVALGGAVQISGALTVPASGVPVSGELNGTIAGGRLLESLGVPLDGTGNLTIRLNGQNGKQNADVALNLAPGSVAGVRHGGMILQADVRDATGKLNLDATLTGTEVVADPATLERIELTARGTPENLAFTLETAGDLQGPTDLSVAGTLRQSGGGMRVTLDRLQGQLAGLPLSQTQPTEVAIGPSGPQSASAGLQIAGASLVLDAKLTGRDKQVNLTVERFDLARLKPFMEGDVPQGTIAASINLQGNRRATGQIRITGRQISVQEEGLPLNPPIDVTLNGSFSEEGLNLQGQLEGGFGKPLTLQAQLPVHVSLADPGVEVDQQAPIDGQLDWEGELGPLVDLLPVGEQRLTGTGVIDLSVAGTLDNPQVGGTVTIRNGRYENLETATVIENLTATLEGSNQRLVIRELSGTDGQNGRLSGSGAIDLAADPAPTVDIKLTMTDFAVARRSDLYARMDIDMGVTGDLANGLDVKGTITNDEIRANVQPDLPASIPNLEVELVRDGKPVNPRRPAGDEEAAPALPIRLDITINLPRRVFVEGAGLDSEWGGTLYVKGTADKSFITGSIGPIRGLFAFFGRQFDLQQGKIDFNGSADINPTLDLSAVYEGDDFTATIKIGGTANQPKLTITSDPEMPRDEILSKVLFGRGTGQISALEALQLAEAASILSGVTGQKRSTVDFLRDTVGLDVLRVEAGDDDEEAVATVGQYISEDVFVGVRQGTKPGSTQATVEVELLPNVTLEGRAATGEEADSGAMLRWKWDY